MPSQILYAIYAVTDEGTEGYSCKLEKSGVDYCIEFSRFPVLYTEKLMQEIVSMSQFHDPTITLTVTKFQQVT